MSTEEDSTSVVKRELKIQMTEEVDIVVDNPDEPANTGKLLNIFNPLATE